MASRRSDSFIRPGAGYHRRSSQDVPQSPASGVFVADSDGEISPTFEHRALPPARAGSSSHGGMASPRRFEGKRKHRAPSAAHEGYFDRRGRDDEEEGGSPSSPVKGNALSKIVSYMGRFGRHDEDEGDEEEGPSRRRRSSSRTRRSFDSQDSRPRSDSGSSSGWGLSDEDEDFSDRPEGEEGYTSSLADDTSLPPQSRPGSPSMPLIPGTGDDIFGERGGRLSEDVEPKDFASTAVPSRQTVILPDEDLSIRFTCYRTDPFRRLIWWAGCIVTFGILGLIGRWVPRTWVRFCGKETAFDEAKEGSWLVVEVSFMISPCER